MHGLQGDYQLIPIPDDDQKDWKFRQIIQKLKTGELDGINVTIPYKQSLLPYLDGLSGDARLVGAVNTVYRSNGKLLGENTDVGGFLTDVQRLVDLKSSGSGLIIGAGGAARAVAVGLIQNGWQVNVAARRIAQAQQLAENLSERIQKYSSIPSPQIRVFDLLQFQTILTELSNQLKLIVNCTPIGMLGKASRRIFPPGVLINKEVRVYDLVYNPPETDFLFEAKQYGLQGLNGMGMLLEQAARSFEIWTGLTLSRPLSNLYTLLTEGAR